MLVLAGRQATRVVPPDRRALELSCSRRVQPTFTSSWHLGDRGPLASPGTHDASSRVLLFFLLQREPLVAASSW